MTTPTALTTEMGKPLPDFTTPDALAKHMGWSSRRVREVARGLGACRIIGNRMVLLERDVQAIMAALGADADGVLEEIAPKPQPREAQRGSIYFIRCNDWIKIGWSAGIKKRLRHIQTNAPGKITLLGKIRGSMKQEKELHARFANHRTSGEWFNASPELLAYIGWHCDR